MTRSRAVRRGGKSIGYINPGLSSVSGPINAGDLCSYSTSPISQDPTILGIDKGDLSDPRSRLTIGNGSALPALPSISGSKDACCCIVGLWYGNPCLGRGESIHDTIWSKRISRGRDIFPVHSPIRCLEHCFPCQSPSCGRIDHAQ